MKNQGEIVFLYQPTSGYCYNSDSIFLADFIAQFNPKGSLLDVGCGVGIISLILSRDFPLESSIIDKQESMLQYARHNFLLNGLKAKAYLGDFETLQTEDRYDFIVSNPPFYDASATQSQNTHLNIARYAQHLPLETLVRRVKTFLRPKGWFIFCYDAKQTDILLQTLRAYKINPEKVQFVHPKLDRDAKLVMIAARNNAKSMTQILPPYIVFDKDSNYTERAMKAFERASTHSIKGDWESE